MLMLKPSGRSVLGHLVTDQRGITRTWICFLKKAFIGGGGESVGLAELVMLESPLFSIFMTSLYFRDQITNGEIQGQLRRVILLLIAQTSHECDLLSISKAVVVFPPHNL